MAIDLSKLENAFFTPGITIVGDPLTFTKTFSGTIPIDSSLKTSIPLTFSRSDIMSFIRVNIIGGNLGSLWFPISGAAGIIDYLTLSTKSGGYYMLFTVTSTATGRTLNIEFINETSGATVVLPSLTITAVVNLFDYPF